MTITNTAFDSRLNVMPNNWADLHQPYAAPISLNDIEYLPILANNTGSVTSWQPAVEKLKNEDSDERFFQRHIIPAGESLIVDNGELYEDTPSYCAARLHWNETRKNQALANLASHAPPNTLLGWCTRVLLATPVGLQPRLLSPIGGSKRHKHNLTALPCQWIYLETLL